MTEEVTDRIKLIPPLPDTYKQINSICNNPNATVDDLIKVVEKDPMLVVNILKTVNSPLFSLKSEIKSVQQAVSLLGMSEINSIAAATSIKKLLKVDMEPYGIEPERFALISNMQGALLKNWFLSIDKEKADTLFMPALLQETGKIIIADEVVRNDETYQFKSDIETSFNISEVEKAYVGVTSAEVTSMVFKHWGFDNFIVNIIKFSDNYQVADEEYREFALYLKIAKTAIAINSPLSQRSVNISLNILKKEGIETEAFLKAIETVKENYEGAI